MNQANEKQATFLGTYFDRDSIMKISRWAEAVAWIVLTLYLLSWAFSLLLFIGQYTSGLYFAKGMTFLDAVNVFIPYFIQPLPGVFYFFGLQAVSKVLLILMDMEENTRRAARKVSHLIAPAQACCKLPPGDNLHDLCALPSEGTANGGTRRAWNGSELRFLFAL